MIGGNTHPYFDDTSMASTLLINSATYFDNKDNMIRVEYFHQILEAMNHLELKISPINYPDFYFFENTSNFTESVTQLSLPPIVDYENNLPIKRVIIDVLSPEDSGVSFHIYHKQTLIGYDYYLEIDQNYTTLEA